MKFILATIFLIIAAFTFVQADILQYVNDIPSCGLKCLLEILPSSACGLGNQSCICTNSDVAAATKLCITQNCTVIESLQVVNVSEISCGRTVHSRQSYLISTAAFEGIVLVAGGLRLLSRWTLERSLKADDYFMIAALALSVPFACLGVLAAVYGFGMNIWIVKPDDLTVALKFFFVDQALYITIQGLCKCSILMFYLRIFPSRSFRKMCLTLAACTTLYTVIFVFLGIFQCTPISYNWQGWKGQLHGKCENLNARAYASAAINITLDFSILLLPVPSLLKLRVSSKRKINVLLLFSVGIFICITSVIRITKLDNLKTSTNPTWDYVSAIYWTAIEVYVSLIVPCLPAIRSLVSHRFPELFAHNDQDQRRRNYEQPDLTGDSFRTSSTRAKLKSESSKHGEFLLELALADKVRGTVSTGVTTNSRTSEEQQASRQGIAASVETNITRSNQDIEIVEVL